MRPGIARQAILAACRGNKFRTRGTWGMRSDVLLGGFGTSERTPCAVIDLERTKAHPTKLGFSLPIALASGNSWDEVHTRLVALGELS